MEPVITSTERVSKIAPDRAVGALLGVAIGDAIGWPQERLKSRLGPGSQKQVPPHSHFIEWERRTGGRYKSYAEVIRPGEYSDDTQLIIATSRSLIKGAFWSQYLAGQELPCFPLYQRGAGSTINAVTDSWLHNRAPWNIETNERTARKYFASGANGAAMRVLPHALISDIPLEDMLEQVMLNSALTHGHPRALLGALLYAQSAWFVARFEGTLRVRELIDYLLDSDKDWSQIRPWAHGYAIWIEAAQSYYNGSYERIWRQTVEELKQGLVRGREELRKGALASSTEYLADIKVFGKMNGSGAIAALAAIFMTSRYAHDPVTGLLEMAFAYGADTDTLGSMVGGLMGALRGTAWILPDWDHVQDRKYLHKLGRQLAELDWRQKGPLDIVPRWQPDDTQRLLDKLINGLDDSRSSLEFGPIGDVAIVEPIQLRQVSGADRWHTLCWKLESIQGQTLYVVHQFELTAEQLPLVEEIVAEEVTLEEEFTTEEVPGYDSVSKPRVISFLSDLAGAVPPAMRSREAFSLTSVIASYLNDILQKQGDEFPRYIYTDECLFDVATKIADEGYKALDSEVSDLVVLIGDYLLGEHESK